MSAAANQASTQSFDAADSELITVAEIVGAYGVKGWVKLKSWTDPAEQVLEYQPWVVIGRNKKILAGLQLEKTAKQANGLIAKLSGCDDRDAAAALRGAQIQVQRDALPGLPNNEYYWADLIGLKVINQQGDDFGKVSSLLDTGANDVLVVDGNRRRMVPFVMEQYVTSIDLEQQLITVDWDSEF